MNLKRALRNGPKNCGATRSNLEAVQNCLNLQPKQLSCVTWTVSSFFGILEQRICTAGNGRKSWARICTLFCAQRFQSPVSQSRNYCVKEMCGKATCCRKRRTAAM